MNRLAKLMVAPNGAYKSKSDHMALPVTIPELCQVAQDSFGAGAEGIHIHIRDANAKHSLDVGIYREALAEISAAAPNMALQITSEAGGMFAPAVQRHTVLNVGAVSASVAVKEMAVEPDNNVTRGFYADCETKGIAIQHIIYDANELATLKGFLSKTAFTSPNLQLLFVLGRYIADGAKGPAALNPFLDQIGELGITPDWAVCAFGQQETNCLLAAHNAGGKMRVGFENSFLNQDGSIAQSNAERVAEIARLTSA